MPRDHQNLAELLVSSWIVSGEDNTLPTSHGLLDRALKEAADRRMFPEWAHSRLHFADSRIGLQCVELPSILDWAQRLELTTAPNPSYRSTEIQVSSRVARALLSELGVSEDEARRLGLALREVVQRVKKEDGAPLVAADVEAL